MLTQMASFAYNHHNALLSKVLISRQFVGRNLFDPFGISKTEVDLLSVSGFHISIYGTTGIRESNVFAMYQKEHPNLADPFEWWSCDPYEPTFKKGFLRNLSEHQQFDRFCPGHPLSHKRKIRTTSR